MNVTKKHYFIVSAVVLVVVTIPFLLHVHGTGESNTWSAIKDHEGPIRVSGADFKDGFDHHGDCLYYIRGHTRSETGAWSTQNVVMPETVGVSVSYDATALRIKNRAAEFDHISVQLWITRVFVAYTGDVCLLEQRGFNAWEVDTEGEFRWGESAYYQNETAFVPPLVYVRNCAGVTWCRRVEYVKFEAQLTYGQSLEFAEFAVFDGWGPRSQQEMNALGYTSFGELPAHLTYYW